MLYTKTEYPLNQLIGDIDLGKIGLPELQRPFVWTNAKVRNLFDSLYRGYPVGFFLFWETGAAAGLRGIGANKAVVPQLAIVDGQQRLTSLYAVIKGKAVKRADFSNETIRIAFSPLTERFEVASAATKNDRSYIDDITALWADDADLFRIAGDYLTDLEQIRTLTASERNAAQSAMMKLRNLATTPFSALTLSAAIDADQVAEVFVRINGEGKKLNQSDFILTLMSVHWDEGRAELEAFAAAAKVPAVGQVSSYNHLIEPAPDRLLRAVVGLGLKRARLEAVYAVLRGRDPVTGLNRPEERDRQFDRVKVAQKQTLDLTNWHDFLNGIMLAGFRGKKMISSEMSVVYSYVLFLIGVTEYGVPRQTMRTEIAAFFFMAALTGRYTTSPETQFDVDLAQIKSADGVDAFLQTLRAISATRLTGDFWKVTLPAILATSAAQSPARAAYQAALILLDAPALYSSAKVAVLADPVIRSKRIALEQHHLFPRKHLEKQGITDLKQINQIANYAVTEWADNATIGAQAPEAYAPALAAAHPEAERRRMHALHALPEAWWTLDYEDFLVQRRVLMADVIRQAWERLSGDGKAAVPAPTTLVDLIAAGEGDAVEYKSTLRTNLHTRTADPRMELAALKTIAAFLNAGGGTLVIGVQDDGVALGIAADGFANEDKMKLHLVNLIGGRIGQQYLPFVHPHFDDHGDQRVLVVRCEKGPSAAFVQDGSAQRFYVRGGAATAELTGPALHDYLKARFV